MPVNKKQRFVALLSNACPGLVGIELVPGIPVRRRPLADVTRLCNGIHGSTDVEFGLLLQEGLFCTTDKGRWVYLADGLILAPLMDESGILTEHREHEACATRVTRALEKVRLVADGNIQIPAHGFFERSGNGWDPVSWSQAPSFLPFAPLTMRPGDRRLLRKVLASSTYPPKRDYLRAAWNSFQASYEHYDTPVGFLLLVIAIECLFNDGGSELRHRLSRTIAVLLGDSKEEAAHVAALFKATYDKRSAFVHRGAQESITAEDSRNLRSLVRPLLALVSEANVDKRTVIELATEAGYGSGALVRRGLRRRGRS